MTEIPEWVATFIGQIILENQALRRTLAEMQQAAPQPATNGHVLDPEPSR